MGKNKNKNKDETPNPTSVANRDTLQRLNFLYQASVLLNGLDPSRDECTGTEQESSSSRKKKKRRVVSFTELSRSYVETMKSVGQKTNVKIDPSVKRRLCKRCSSPLIPGISAAVRIKDSASHGHLVSYQCHCCREERRIPAPPVLHLDPEDVMQTQPAEASVSTMPAAGSPGSAIGPQRHKPKRMKKGPQPRLLPHFARDVGHVVFRGNERIDEPRMT